ncbi:hypothetical protein [Clostridium felsineum]|uniref:Uncharacterized protein n=1 Tax=Clostridium felsineum TaxID=36839 RepID=A0A1S8LU32_9CLOT|nr:hypothetical protein [Clostridium felsineum]MCR3760602.1 hypothetical protein [Clostridium felsineum]URZ00476.1 hypothetical protein CLAUR_004640 [Clostridium felsineum]URZ06885.1 hypothetical protein CLROS_022180 [Clostridium felsineum]URZ11917.1 hypothetical protein CROST_026340 [Clostridium felsineum]URZ16452.1 hypothetical protein CLFE_024990 [Clostridium felsineum DSM 794]
MLLKLKKNKGKKLKCVVVAGALGIISVSLLKKLKLDKQKKTEDSELEDERYIEKSTSKVREKLDFQQSKKKLKEYLTHKAKLD